MDDNYDWSNEGDGSHAAHKPLQANPQKRSPEKQQEALRRMASLRDVTGIKPAEPKRINTAAAEKELKTRPIIERGAQ